MKKSQQQNLNIKVDNIHQILLCHTGRNSKDFLKSIDSSIELIPLGEVNSEGFCKFYFKMSFPKDIFYLPVS